MALAPALDLRPSGDPRDSVGAEPANIEAEQALLGALLYEPTKARRLITVELRPEHFYEPFHGRLYKAICDWLLDGEAPDPTLLSEEFRKDPAYLELGGVRYLADLVDRAPPFVRAGPYAANILDQHIKRQLILLSVEMAASARDGHAEGLDILDQLESACAQLRVASAEPGAFIHARQAAADALAEIQREAETGRPRGIQTGLRCFDTRMGGLQPTWLVTIGGRPGMGKTALARATMYAAADRNRLRTFAFFSMETPNRELSERALAAGTTRGMDGHDVREHGSGAVQMTSLSRSQIGMTEAPWLEASVAAQPDNLFLFDNPILSLSDVRRTVWALKAKGDLAAVAIDYLQLMQREQTRGRTDAALIGDITTGLKRLAMEAHITVLLVSQLSRGVDSRDDKRPILSDLRESGSIEQDSNAVMFPYREAYYLERVKPEGSETSPEYLEWKMKMLRCEDLMEVITAKLRQGKPGADKQLYLAAYDAVSDWTKD
jgi:replicative DNA helicase